jgi:hypothetical protein
MTGIKEPTPATLKRHGLTVQQWREMLDRQDGQCSLCPAGHLPPSRILNIDHEHVRGYWDMQPERKRRYHRGLVCYWHNKNFLARGATPELFDRAAAYLRAYQERKAADGG